MDGEGVRSFGATVGVCEEGGFVCPPCEHFAMQLDGRTVFITGAGAGIGRATAERCAEDGARVVMTDVDADGGYSAW